MGTDGISDFQIPLDEDRNYTIVVSRAGDRPANATDENGVAWMDWGTKGEGIDDELNRPDFGLLVFRFMHNNPDWKHNPEQHHRAGDRGRGHGPLLPAAVLHRQGHLRGGRSVRWPAI